MLQKIKHFFQMSEDMRWTFKVFTIAMVVITIFAFVIAEIPNNNLRALFALIFALVMAFTLIRLIEMKYEPKEEKPKGSHLKLVK